MKTAVVLMILLMVGCDGAAVPCVDCPRTRPCRFSVGKLVADAWDVSGDGDCVEIGSTIGVSFVSPNGATFLTADSSTGHVLLSEQYIPDPQHAYPGAYTCYGSVKIDDAEWKTDSECVQGMVTFR